MIFGIDLGTRRVALACPEMGYVDSRDLARYKVDKDAFGTEVQAGEELGLWLLGQLDCLCLSPLDMTFFAERPIVGRPHLNMRTTVGQALSAGAALSRLPGRMVLLDSASTWKKALNGNGHAGKDEVRAWVQDHQPATAALCGEDQNRYDAVAIACAGAVLLAQPGQL